MRIAVTGTSGQLVTALLHAQAGSSTTILALGRPLLDLTRHETIESTLRAAAPDVVISAAAYTAVDQAEEEPDAAFAINARGAGAVAEAAAQLGLPIIHLSTDYVFDGRKPTPYLETDDTNPLGIYGASKLQGEQLVAAATPNHAIIRVAWVYSPFRTNFVKTMLRLAETRPSLSVVSDQIGSPSSALDIAEALLSISKRLASDGSAYLRGVFHLPSAGEASWAEFADAIFEGAAKRGHPSCKINHILTSDYPTLAKRPANSRLDGSKIAEVYGVRMPHWCHSLQVCLDTLLAHSAGAQHPNTSPGDEH
ncbi:dTDP-4-dehydrorhamnose reductase [Geminicoccus harenae]|uniref:dTDP-4-dehydrorhamnose reductase n=1 Tax=Geminicoccus harenae TaxID=2498453 RepID=UPI00168B8739|nr:dTDP-4-dehydrorhamnose reductase [Geminicoccus harenae]